jgi:sucrose phosphorylase
MDLLARSGVGRDINRQRFSPSEIEAAMQKPVVQDLLQLIRLRNTFNAFNGTFALLESSDACLHVRWVCGGDKAELFIDFSDLSYQIGSEDGHSDHELVFRS